MKKIFFIAIAALMLAVNVNAEVKFGLKGGYNVSSMSLNSSVLSTSNRSGFYIGPTVKIGLPIFDVDAAAVYDQRDMNASGNGVSKSDKLKNIALQANLRKGFGLGDAASFFVFAGPQVAFNVGGKNINEEDVNWKWKDSNFSVNVGIGVMFLKHVELKANYNIDCGKTGNVTIKSISESSSAKSNAWQVGVAYYF